MKFDLQWYHPKVLSIWPRTGSLVWGIADDYLTKAVCSCINLFFLSFFLFSFFFPLFINSLNVWEGSDKPEFKVPEIRAPWHSGWGVLHIADYCFFPKESYSSGNPSLQADRKETFQSCVVRIKSSYMPDRQTEGIIQSCKNWWLYSMILSSMQRTGINWNYPAEMWT